MEWPSLLVVIVASSGLFYSKTTTSILPIQNYVQPSANKVISCPEEQRPCLTLNEYANEPKVYFVNNVVFYFYPGSHRLGSSLRLKNIHNISFQGLPTTGTSLRAINVTIDSLASITWEESWNIEISSMSFILRNNFTFIIRFESSLFIYFSNISILGNGYTGCSSIMTQKSALYISNSIFTGLNGFLGAVMMAVASNVTFSGNNIFFNNTAAASGGSLYFSGHSMLTLKGTNLFLNNTSLGYNWAMVNLSRKMSLCNYSVRKIWKGHGGAIFCSASHLRVYEYSNFTHNVAKISGGAIILITGGLTIQGNTSFDRNMAYTYYGGAMMLYSGKSKISGNLYLNNNTAIWGGAIYIKKGILFIQGYAMFDKNYAEAGGGALYIISVADFKFCGSIYYRNNTADGRGGALHITYSRALFNDKCVSVPFHKQNSVIFSYNTVVTGVGGSIHCWEGSNVQFIGTVYFTQSHDSAIRNDDCNITFVGTTYFYRNTGKDGGAILSSNSKIMLSGAAYFERNIANTGGAIWLEGSSKLIFKPKVNISFILNYANNSGGALYFEDSQCLLESTIPRECFITIDSESDGPFGSMIDISLHFVNNSAGVTGSLLYGGNLNNCSRLFLNPNQCIYKAHNYCNNSDVLGALMNISTVQRANSVLNISSQAIEVEFCGNVKVIWDLYPGQQFIISLIALGRTNFPVPTTILWERVDKNSEYRLSPLSHSINSSCTSVPLQLHSTDLTDYIEFKLYPDNPCHSLIEGVTLSIHVLSCPFGFDLKGYECVCDKIIKKFTQNCYIDSNSKLIIERVSNSFWISKSKEGNAIIIHEFRCPLDYCRSDPLNVTLDNPSIQCNFSRTGILCGQCQKYFSLALGSLQCIPCDNKHAALIVFFALAGVVLITIIFLFRLTIAVGTLNGLFFYANIIQANHQAFFPRATINFSTVFISLLNLDFGIESCFYDGMDIYTYSWFQFLFPFYLWFLVGCIILASRYSRSIAKLFGQNPVAVLATLFLMSYSKLLQAIIAPLSWTHLTFYRHSNETQNTVWLYDASIHFFKEPKHTALGLFAIFSLMVLVLPYIFLLIIGHWLQGCSNWWILSWLNKIKPFMDAYHAPYRKHTRYWTGLLLLSRLGLFLTFAINANGSESINILAVSSVSLALLAIQKRVYERWWKDLLESSFILNLGIFSVATFYLKEESEDVDHQFILSSISVGIAFITFIGISLFHISLVLKSLNIWTEHMVPFIKKSLLISKIFRITSVKDNTTTRNVEATVLHALPTSTEVAIDLNKPLLLEITADTATYD